MFNKKRIQELEYEVATLKRNLEWARNDGRNMVKWATKLRANHNRLVEFLGIEEKKCEPGLTYKEVPSYD